MTLCSFYTKISLCGLLSFDFCAPPKNEIWKNSPSENLGQVVFGERIRPSVYKVLLEIIPCSCDPLVHH